MVPGPTATSACQPPTSSPLAAEKDLLDFLAFLPPLVRSVLEALPSLPQLVEVVMDLGRPPLARLPEGDLDLSQVRKP